MVNFIVFWKHFGNHISCNISYIVLSSLEQIVYFIVKPMFSIFSSKPRSHDKSPSMTFRTKIWTLPGRASRTNESTKNSGKTEEMEKNHVA